MKQGNKYTRWIEKQLENNTNIGGFFSAADGAKKFYFAGEFWLSSRKLGQLNTHSEHKLQWIMFLAIVDQETADAMLEELKEPVES